MVDIRTYYVLVFGFATNKPLDEVFFLLETLLNIYFQEWLLIVVLSKLYLDQEFPFLKYNFKNVKN